MKSNDAKSNSENEGMRINRYLSDMGVCSRREADRLIEEGEVLIDGVPAKLGQKTEPGQRITVKGREISVENKDKPVLIAFNKPRGVVCTTSTADRAVNIIEYINYPLRIFPVGRLDKDSQGLILLTNQGELVNKINRQRYGHEKEYIVSCRRPVTDEFLKAMSEGVKIRIPVTDVTDRDKRNARGREYVDKVTRPCKAWRVDRYTFGIILTQGYNRQIRRMCDALGNYVKTLKRIRVMNIELSHLKEGEYRDVTGEELMELQRLIEEGR